MPTCPLFDIKPTIKIVYIPHQYNLLQGAFKALRKSTKQKFPVKLRWSGLHGLATQKYLITMQNICMAIVNVVHTIN